MPTVEEALQGIKKAVENGRKDAVWLQRPMQYNEFVEIYGRPEDSFVTCIEYANYVMATLHATNRDHLIYYDKEV